jgi:transcriptional regulator with XRE-family HTH domain
MLLGAHVNIRKLRRLARLTQVELAKRTGISRVRLSMAECGYLSLTSDERMRVSQVARNEVELRLRRIALSVQRPREETD